MGDDIRHGLIREGSALDSLGEARALTGRPTAWPPPADHGQAAALNISRGSEYCLPRPVSAADLALMGRIDELHLEFPFAGSRLLRGIEALTRRPRTTKLEPGHKIYPYLLRGTAITRPNQVWAMDITYISMARGFVAERARRARPQRPIIALGPLRQEVKLARTQ